MEVHVFPRRIGMIVMDGKRVVAKARCVGPPGGGKWMLRAYGFEWTGPDAAKPNAFGHIDRKFIVVDSKPLARKYLQALARTGSA